MKRQRSAIELGRAMTQMGKSIDILPLFMQKHLSGVDFSTPGHAMAPQSAPSVPPGQPTLLLPQHQHPPSLGPTSYWQFQWGPLPKLDTSATDAFVVQKVTPLKDLVRYERINQEPLRARLIFSNKSAAESARTLLLSVQSMKGLLFSLWSCA